MFLEMLAGILAITNYACREILGSGGDSYARIGIHSASALLAFLLTNLDTASGTTISTVIGY